MLYNKNLKRTAELETSKSKPKRPALGDVTNKHSENLSAEKLKAPMKKGTRRSQRLATNVQQTRVTRQSANSHQTLAKNADDMDLDHQQPQYTGHNVFINIDQEDDGDCTLCVDYSKEIDATLKENELRHRPKVTDYLSIVQKDVNTNMRGILMDWLVEVAEEYGLTSETLYLTKNYVDRYLALQPVSRSHLQLLGVACMLIASKFEEVYAPAVDEFVYISDNTYKRDEILQMESSVLNVLGFSLSAATEKSFLNRFQRAALANFPDPDPGLANTFRQLSSYLCELTTQEYTFVQHRPSVIAAAATFLALHALDLLPWTPTLEHYSGLTVHDLDFCSCVKELYALSQQAPRATLKAVYEKFLQPQFGEVSKILIRTPC